MTAYIIGLDFGTESARGVLLDATTGVAVANHVHPYRYGVMTAELPNGRKLPRDWALQHAPDYTEAAEAVLTSLGKGREIRSIGLDFTASTPLPCLADGTPLSDLYPDEPHAYVKLWKHHAAKPWADRITAAKPDFLRHYSNRTSSEWVLAKAGQIADEAPEIWRRAERFIEAGDWMVWQLTGIEARSKCQAGYKVHYQEPAGYPVGVVPGLNEKLTPPLSIGEAAGELSLAWRAKTGIEGPATVAVAVIDAHAVMPAVAATQPGVIVGALGTSACYMLLDKSCKDIPGIEGAVLDGAISGLWCYESGQAAFGDVLAWFIRNFPRGADEAASFAAYNEAAAKLPKDEMRPIAIDWWNGCRVPLGDSALSGLMVGMSLRHTAVDLYHSLMEALCFGARRIVDTFTDGGAAVERVVLTSGIAERNPLLMQMMADVLGREVEVPSISNATATGAAIHGAVAAGLVADYDAGAILFGAKTVRRYHPDQAAVPIYERRYRHYLALCQDSRIIDVLHDLAHPPATNEDAASKVKPRVRA
ncbi:MAG TPA: ribulokinase [Terriglobia bacterium]|nr:ribulokinase [Terriglobia bacterium]